MFNGLLHLFLFLCFSLKGGDEYMAEMIQIDEHTFPKANLEAKKGDFHYFGTPNNQF